MNKLLHAIRNDDLLSVQQILDKEPHLARESNKFGITPLHEATEVGSLKLVQTLLEYGAEIDAKDKYEHTPLFKAIWFLQYDIVNLLLDRGADIHVRDHNGHTLLHWAAFKGEKDMVELLLDRGARIDLANRESQTPIDYALLRKAYDVVELIEMARRKREQIPQQSPSQEDSSQLAREKSGEILRPPDHQPPEHRADH